MGKKDKVSFAKVQSIFFFTLIGVLSITMIYLFHPFLFPIFWAAVIAIIFYPVYRWLEEHLNFENLSSLLSVLMVIAMVFLPLILLSILLVEQSINIYNATVQGNYIEEIQKLLQLLKDTPLAPYIEQIQEKLIKSANEIAKTITLTLFSSAKQITSASVRLIVQFVIMLYTLFYFFKDGPEMLERLMHLSPLGDKYEKKLYEKFTSTVSATLKSFLVIGGIQGALGGFLFWLVGIDGALIWSVIMLVLAIIPSLGAPFVIVPASFILLALGDIPGGLILFAGSFVVGFIDNFLRPILVGHDIHMHPLIVLFSSLGGLVTFGISGFVIGPIIASLFLAIVSIYDSYYQQELSHN